MPLGTVDRTAPPLFDQGPSALSKLIFFSSLSLLLMVADARFHIVAPLRSAVSTVLFPVQWVAMKPVQVVRLGTRYFEELQAAQAGEAQARKALAQQSMRASQVETLAGENARLRALLALRESTPTTSHGAEVLYDAADPYSRKVVIDQGQTEGIVPGSPVIDELGVIGQVTSVQPFSSEVTLVIDRELSVPVKNMRTGARSVAFGDATALGGGIELRFTQASSDVQEGDVLATSGVDGIYPAGLPVGRIERIERRADSAFARIRCEPFARVRSARYVLVLSPVGEAPPLGAGTPAAASGAPAAGKKNDAGKTSGSSGDPGKADAKAPDALDKPGKAEKAKKSDKPDKPNKPEKAADKPQKAVGPGAAPRQKSEGAAR